MKKFFIFVLLGISLFLLAGCGDSKEEDKKDNNKTEEKQKKETKKEEPPEEDVIVNKPDDDEIIDVDDEENKPPVDAGRVTVEKVINCEGCVYSYFDKEKPFGATLTSEEYTTDINNIRTPGNKQRHNFFGFVLSGNKISRAYSCILKDNKIYCVEGTTNGAKFESNKAILNQIFTSGQCGTISDGHTYTCTDGSYNGDTKSNGYASLHYETSCVIFGQNNNQAKLNCY